MYIYIYYDIFAMRQGQQRHDDPVVTASSARRQMRAADARAAVRCSICKSIELERRIELKTSNCIESYV